MNEPIRILQVGMTGNLGGIESFIMNVYRNIDRSKVQFDFLTLENQKIHFEKEIEEMGGRIFPIGVRRKHLVRHLANMPTGFLKNHREIKAIHFHKTSLIDIDYIIAAKRANISNIIVHSHSSGNMFQSGKIVKIIEQWNKEHIDNYVDFKFAPSHIAGEWLFRHGDYCIIPNAIDTKKFCFSEEARINKRKELMLADDDFVVGHVGYFTPVKNHGFIVEIFERMKLNKKVKLLFVGDGALKEDIQKHCERFDLMDQIIFLGIRNDMADLYSAMDMFILPSKFEGLPISVIEAQTSGLPVIVSDKITKEVDVTNSVKFLSIEEGVEQWVTEISTSVFRKPENRKAAQQIVASKNYDIKNVASQLEQFYLGLE